MLVLLLSGFFPFEVAVPKEKESCHEQIGSSQQVEDAVVQPKSGSSLVVLKVGFNSGFTHGTLGERFRRMNQKKKEYDQCLFHGAKIRLMLVIWGDHNINQYTGNGYIEP